MVGKKLEKRIRTLRYFFSSRSPCILAGDSVTRHNTTGKEEIKETTCSRLPYFTKKIKMFWSNYIPNFWQFRKRIYPIGLIIWTQSHLSSQPSSTLPHLSNFKPQEGIILGSSMDRNRFRSSPLFSACLMPADREWFQIWQETLNWHVCR